MNYLPIICPFCHIKLIRVNTPETFTLRCECSDLITKFWCTYYLASCEVHQFSIIVSNIKFHWLDGTLYIYKCIIQDEMPVMTLNLIKKIRDIPAPNEEQIIEPNLFINKYKYLVVFS